MAGEITTEETETARQEVNIMSTVAGLLNWIALHMFMMLWSL